MNGNDAQTIVKILAEAPLGDFLLEVLVRRGDHAHVDVGLFRAADGPDLAFLQDAIELHLHGDAHVADFVQKQRAAVRRLEKPAAVFVGAGERALDVAEKLGFQQGFRETRRN